MWIRSTSVCDDRGKLIKSRFFILKQKTAYKMRISDWSSDVCSSDLLHCEVPLPQPLETLALEGIPADPLKAFLEHHGFNSLLARLGAGAAKAVVAAATAPAAARPEPEAPRLNTTPAIDRKSVGSGKSV